MSRQKLSEGEKTIAPIKTVLEIHDDCVKELIRHNEHVLRTTNSEQIYWGVTAGILGYDKRYLERCDECDDRRYLEQCDNKKDPPPCGYILKNKDSEYELWDNNGLTHKGIKYLADIGLCDNETCNQWNAIRAKEKIRLQLQKNNRCGLCASANIIVMFSRSHNAVITCNDCGATEMRHILNEQNELYLDKPIQCELCGTTNTKNWGEISSFSDWDLPTGITLKLGDVTFEIGENAHRLCMDCYAKYETEIDTFEDNIDSNQDQLKEQMKNQRLEKLQKMSKKQLIKEIKELEDELEEARS
jgi:ribosomal protein S27E